MRGKWARAKRHPGAGIRPAPELDASDVELGRRSRVRRGERVAATGYYGFGNGVPKRANGEAALRVTEIGKPVNGYIGKYRFGGSSESPKDIAEVSIAVHR